ncbi:MAG: four helix bundle protein [Bacteroidota bacterium]
MKQQNERPHKRLELWKKSIEMVTKVYEVTKEFPREEVYGLTSQLRKAAVSVPSNIAEGLTRRSSAEKLHFLSIFQGSCSEIDTQAEIALRLGFLTEKQFDLLEEHLIHVQRLLGGIIRSIKAMKST